MRKKIFAMFSVLVLAVFMPQLILAEELSYEGGSELGVRVMPEAAKKFEAKTGICCH